jgi:hypothetical protein
VFGSGPTAQLAQGEPARGAVEILDLELSVDIHSIHRH